MGNLVMLSLLLLIIGIVVLVRIRMGKSYQKRRDAIFRHKTAPGEFDNPRVMNLKVQPPLLNESRSTRRRKRRAGRSMVAPQQRNSARKS